LGQFFAFAADPEDDDDDVDPEVDDVEDEDFAEGVLVAA
jgi:hypothetical protein